MTKCRQQSLPLQHKHLWPGAADKWQPCLGPGPELTRGHAAPLGLDVLLYKVEVDIQQTQPCR